MKLGSAFFDNVVSEKYRSRAHLTDKSPAWWIGRGKPLFILTIAICAIAVLMFRLFHLTIVEGHSMRALSDENRTRELIRHAPRGQLKDRTGKVLTDNIPQYHLSAPCPGELEKLCTTTLSEQEAEQRIAHGLSAGSYIELDYMRRYVLDAATSHILGYTGEISEKEMHDEYYQLRKYIPGDRVGRTGAEAVYEERLRGRNGRELVEVNAQGVAIRTLGIDKEIAGSDVTLALDAKLADIARQAFPPDAQGAVIVMKPKTGEILAMYSQPSYSANAFTEGLTAQEYENILSGPNRPMFNRTISGAYPPGSTYKIVTSIAALEEGAISPNTTIEDTGVIKVGSATYTNWYFTKNGGTDGAVNIVKGLERSNDTFFYHVGEKLGVDKLAKWSRILGIGKPLGIELSGEASGLMPDPVWKAKIFSTPQDREARNDLWYTGDNYNLAIGQGYLLTTPLQVVTWTSAVANAGYLCRPTIEKVDSTHKASCKQLQISQSTLESIQKGLVRACEPKGTGWPFFDFRIPQAKLDTQSFLNEASPGATLSIPTLSVPVACKTGTAETGIPGKTLPHAWFTVYAPVPLEYVSSEKRAANKDRIITGDPEIAITVLVENGGEGSSVAAPIAKKILAEWFGR